MHFPAGDISIDEQIEPAMKLKQEAHSMKRTQAGIHKEKTAKRDAICSCLSGVMEEIKPFFS